MPIASLGTLIPMPEDTYTNLGVTWQGSFYLDGTNVRRFALIFQAQQTGEIDLVEMYIGFISGANDVKISIQDVDASGLPDGTDDVYKVSSKATGWQSYALTDTGSAGGNRKAVVKGTYYAIVGKWNATESGGFEPHGLTTAGNLNLIGGSYCASYNGTSWTKTAGVTVYPSFAIKYSDGNYYPIINARPINSIAAETFASNSTPDERGLLLVPTAPIRVAGFWMIASFGNACDVVLYDSANTVLASLSLDPDVQSSTGQRTARFMFATPVTLEAGETYRLVMKPTTTSSNSLYVATLNASALMAAWPHGTTWHYTARTDAGSWSQTTTKRPFIGVLVDGIDDGSSIGAVEMVSLPSPITWPPSFPSQNFGGISLGGNSNVMDASGEKIAIIVRAPKTGTLKSFAVKSTAFNTGTLKFSFQDIDPSTGGPDGTIDQYSTATNGNSVWVQPTQITSDGTSGGTKRTVTKDDLVCCVIEFNAFSSGHNFGIMNQAGDIAEGGRDLVEAYYAEFLTGSWVRFAFNGGAFALEYDDGTYGQFSQWLTPMTALASRTFSSSDTPDERGNRFVAPSTVQCDGIWARIDLDGPCQAVLYDNSNVVLASSAMTDPDVRGNNAASIASMRFSTPVTLERGSTYRMTIKPSSATSVVIWEFTVPSAALMGAVPGGADMYSTSRADAGSWTDTNTQRYFMGLIITGILGDGGDPPETGGVIISAGFGQRGVGVF
jgi:hypothetical protein